MKLRKYLLCIILTATIIITPIETPKGIAASDYINNSMPEITDGTDYSKIVSDPEFKKLGLQG